MRLILVVNVPSNLLSLCAHKISFVQHFTTINLYVESSRAYKKYVQKHF